MSLVWEQITQSKNIIKQNRTSKTHRRQIQMKGAQTWRMEKKGSEALSFPFLPWWAFTFYSSWEEEILDRKFSAQKHKKRTRTCLSAVWKNLDVFLSCCATASQKAMIDMICLSFFLSMFIINGWKCSPGIYSCGFSRRRRKKEKKQMFCFVLCAKTKRSPRKTQCNYEIAAIYI